MNYWKILAGSLAGIVFLVGSASTVMAATYPAETPVAGVAITINNYNARLEVTPYMVGNEKQLTTAEYGENSISGVSEAAASAYANIAVSRVEDYVNVRDIPSTEGAVVGKIYDGCAATILETEGDWYEIESGSVRGFIKAEFFVTGAEAEALVPELATKYAVVRAETLNVRAGASLDAEVVATVPYGEEFVIIEEQGNWARMELDAAVSGWVSLDYLGTRVEFDMAVSVEEEAKKEAEAAAAKQRAEEAMVKAEEEARANELARKQAQEAESRKAAEEESKKAAEEESRKAEEESQKAEEESQKAEEESRKVTEEESGRATEETSQIMVPGPNGELVAEELTTSQSEEEETTTWKSEQETGTSSGSNAGPETSNQALREAIVAYALQFVGNPYVYGGNSLTTGTDCSGFVLLIYKEFGYSLERRASYQYKYNGTQIAISDILPGDLIFYGSSEVDHVALYMGNNQVVHASTEKTGIKISTLSYRDIYGAVRILG